MQRAVLVLFLVAGFANSAILDSSKSPQSKNTDWDDEDSMTLASTPTPKINLTSNDATTIPSSSEDLVPEEQQRPRFISLIPAGTHDVNAHSKSDQEGQDQVKYRIYLNPTTTDPTTESEQDDSSASSTTPSSSSEEEEDLRDSESSDQSTTEGSQIKHIQLGKIPLTYEVIPLLPPREEKQQLLGREDTTPIGFYPPEASMMDKAKYLQREQQQQQTQHSEEEDSTEIITGRPVVDLKELPPMPLTYMVPPQQDEEGVDYWHQYPQPSTTLNLRNLESPQTTTINPLLERINDFLQKAKRHSLEMETTTGNDNESTTSSTTTTTAEEDTNNTEKMETTTSAEQGEIASTEGDKDNQDNVSTTDPLTPISDAPEDSNGDLNPSSPAPIPEEPTEEIYTTRGPTILYPRPNIPEIQDTSPEFQPFLPYPSSSSPLPPPLNSINIHPASMDQYYSDYSNINNNVPVVPQQQPINPYSNYYTDSNPASILRRRMMISSLLNNIQQPITTTTTTLPPPPSRPVYISPESYWPRKYLNNGGLMGSRTSTGYNNNYYTPNSNYNNNANNNYNTYNTYDPYMTSSPSGGGYNNDFGQYYLRPQRQSPGYSFPTTSTSIPLGEALNSILSSTSEEPSYPSSYGPPGLNDFSSFENPYYSRSSIGGGSNYYSYPSATTQAPSPYVMNYRPMIPYRRSYPITSSDLVNELMMYAPLYPYEQYRRIQLQQPNYY